MPDNEDRDRVLSDYARGQRAAERQEDVRQDARQDARAEARQDAQDQLQARQRVDTDRFPILEPRPAFYPVQRPYCEQHSGVCVEIVRMREDLAALKADKGSSRARLFNLIASFIGGGGGAVLTYLLTR
jgi:hypothetical protein